MCGCINSWSMYFYRSPVSCGISGTGCRDKLLPTSLPHFLMTENQPANTHPRGSTIPRQAVCAESRSVPCQGWWCRVPEPPSMFTGTTGAQLSPSCWGLMLELPSCRSTVPILGSAGLVLPAWSGTGGHQESTQAAADGLQKASISCL